MRITAFIFALFYLICSVGYGLEVHYCLGEVSDVNHTLLGTNCPCDDAHVEGAMNCCEERSFFNQIEEEHAAPKEAEPVAVLQTSLLSCNDVLVSIPSRPIEHQRLDRGPPRTVDLTTLLVRRMTYG